jgi:SAM-dependent methyltransferase
MGLYLGIALGAACAAWVGWNLTLDAMWQPTDRLTVQRILRLARLRREEHLVDLGCGDGRIVIAAARRFGARATGVEIDPLRALWGKAWIRLAGLSKRARVVWGDMYKADLSDADVVVLFLSATSNFKLEGLLKRGLRPGARVVSYYHPIWGWKPERIGQARGGYSLYLYRIGGANAADAR